MTVAIKQTKPIPGSTDTELKYETVVSGTDSGAYNGLVVETATSGTTVATGSLVGLCGKAYLETLGIFTNSAGLLAGVVGLLKAIGTVTYDNSSACVVGQVHADSTHTIGAIFKAINGGSGTVTSVWDSKSVASPTYLFTYVNASGLTKGITPTQWDAIVSTNCESA